MDVATIAVVGAGSWGTALAILLARNGHNVRLWGNEPDLMQQMAKDGCNRGYLPNSPFPDSLIAHVDLADAVTGSDDVLIVVPSHAFVSVLEQLQPYVTDTMGVVWATKGLTSDSGDFLDHAVTAHLGERPMAVLAGPSFAKEVAENLPTAVDLASNEATFAKELAAKFHNPYFRVYLSNDLRGVQFCGAAKNVFAIAAGISDGLGFGANARAALITRGLAEMMRLGVALGAQAATFNGLAGIGDLVLTCTDNQSRNRRFGLAIGQGVSIKQAQRTVQQVVEGYYNARQVHALAQRYRVEMPIVQEVLAVLTEQYTPQQAVRNLLSRIPKTE